MKWKILLKEFEGFSKEVVRLGPRIISILVWILIGVMFFVRFLPNDWFWIVYLISFPFALGALLAIFRLLGESVTIHWRNWFFFVPSMFAGGFVLFPFGWEVSVIAGAVCAILSSLVALGQFVYIRSE